MIDDHETPDSLTERFITRLYQHDSVAHLGKLTGQIRGSAAPLEGGKTPLELIREAALKFYAGGDIEVLKDKSWADIVGGVSQELNAMGYEAQDPARRIGRRTSRGDDSPGRAG